MVPIFQPRPPFRHRARAATPPPPPPPPPPPGSITISDVVPDTSTSIEWDFSDTVTLTGANVPQLQVGDGMGGWLSPISVTQAGDTTLYAEYSEPVSFVGTRPWRLNSAPANIAESASINVPESGTYG